MSAHICGDYKTSYKEDMVLFQTVFSKFWIVAFFISLIVVPLFLDNYTLYVCNMIGIAIIGALGLNILTGFTGQISLGHGAFIGIGAYASAYLVMDLGMPFFIALPCAGLITAMFGMVFGIPSLRLKGLYLAIATLAAQFIIEYLMVHMEGITNGVLGKMVDFPSFMGYHPSQSEKHAPCSILHLPVYTFGLLTKWKVGGTNLQFIYKRFTKSLYN